MFDLSLNSLLFFTIYWCSKWMAQSAPIAPVGCPTGWFGHDWSGMCYKPYHNLRLKWNNARKICHKDGGDLAITKDDKVQEFINDHLSTSRSYWIGLQYMEHKWVDGQEADIENTGGSGGNTFGYLQSDGGDKIFSKQAGSHYDVHSFICETAPLGSDNVCPSQWTMHMDNGDNQTCYKVYGDDRKSWREARTMCKKDEAHLVTIESEATDQFIKGLISDPDKYWVAKIDLDTPESTQYPVITWDVGEPSMSPIEQCVMIYNNKHKGYTLHDNVCGETYPYICEKDLTMRCDEGWHIYKNKTCFEFFYKHNERKKFNQAQQHCKSNGGNLAKIPDQETDNYLKNILNHFLQVWIHHPQNVATNANGRQWCNIAVLTTNKITTRRANCSHRHYFLCEGSDVQLHTPRNWSEAKKECGESVIVPHTVDSATDLISSLWSLLYWPKHLHIWYIGLKETNEGFKWSDGSLHENGSYLGFAENQPNGDNQHCIVIYTTNFTFQWHDIKCDKSLAFICQKDAEPEDQCPDSWETSQRKCYRFYRNDRRTWTLADQRCRDDNGQLLKIDEESNGFVVNHTSSGPERLWIGAKHKNKNNSFVWDQENKPMTYRGWSSHEPSDRDSESCATIAHYKDNNQGYLWDDVHCSQEIPYICQTDAIYPLEAFFCPEGYTVYEEGQACFKPVHNKKLPWEDARHYCQDEGGDLAVFPDVATDDFVAGLLTNLGRYSFGLRRSEHPGQDFEWINETIVWSMPSDRWHTGEPSSHSEKCVEHRNVFSTGKRAKEKYFSWNDVSCAMSSMFICEREGYLAWVDLKEVDFNGQTYYIPYEELLYRDVEDVCQLYNLTQLFIQSNDHFKQVQAWVSNISFLQGDDIWIKTDKPLFWDFNVWSNNEFVSPDAWVSDIQDRECSQQEDCCVVMTNETSRGGHYLTNTNCSGMALYICVEENMVISTTIPPPKLEPDNSKSLTKLQELMDANNKTQNNKCPCRCGMNFDPNPTPQILEQMKAQIVKELSVNVRNLSSTVSKKQSATDSRPSSTTIGYGSIVMILIPLCIIIAIDMTRFWKKEDE